MFDFTLPHAADALATARRLQSAGFVAYFAGGCVRDALLGRAPKDFDVATDATPEKVRELFGKRQTLAFGASFGVIGVLGSASSPTEVATFRSDGTYSDGRRPDSVRFGNAQDDALRRDFTINGMFYDPVQEKVIDYVSGQEDLRLGLIRAIGTPAQRIAEDKLRMLRAVRFASSLQFDIEASTLQAIQQTADEIHAVSGERIGAELRRMFCQANVSGQACAEKSARSGYAWRLLNQSHLLRPLWPPMAEAVERNPAVMERAAKTLGAITAPSFAVAIACLIIQAELPHDRCIEQLAEHWKLSCDEQRAISACVKQSKVAQEADHLPWSTVQPVLVLRDALAVVGTASAIATANGESVAGIRFCQAKLNGSHDDLDPAPLVTGDRLKQLGFQPGPKFRDVLQTIRQEQLDGQLFTQDQAIERAKQLM